MDWWRGTQEGDVRDPTADYAAHLACIRDRLPPDLLVIEDSLSLHDVRLRELQLLPAKASLLLGLESYSGKERFTLCYSGVERFESLSDPKVGLLGPAGYGDLGYYEVDLLSNGGFEHRLLFSSGIELVVLFSGFRLIPPSALKS